MSVSHTYRRFSKPVLILFGIMLGLFCLGSPTQAQSPEVEEIVVGFEIPRLLAQDIFVQYDGETVYLPVVEVFHLFGFNVTADLSEKRITGYMEDKSRKFLIDLIKFRVRAPNVDRDLLRSEFYFDGRELYLRVDRFSTYFGLPMTFDFSLLRVLVPLKEDFPAFQKIKRQKARDKLRLKKESLQDVLQMDRDRSIVGAGVLDWRITANPIGGSGQFFDAELGAVVLGGDVTVTGGGNTKTGFDTDRLDYHWHYFFGNNPYMTQADVGNFFTDGILGRGFKGIGITNKPQIKRKYFRTIQLSGFAGEGYEVELYVDNRLVDFVDVDASGNYDFNLDIFYGTSDIELKFYGPNGEVRTERQHVRVPFNLIPKGAIEYGVSFGEGTGSEEGRTFTQASGSYGILPRLTAGVQTDMPLSPLPDEEPSYAANTTLQLASNLTLSGFASPDNKFGGDFAFSMPSIVNLNGGYTRYEENPFRNIGGQKQRVQFSVSAPFKFGGKYFGARYFISFDEFRPLNTDDSLSSRNSTTMTYGLNASVDPISLNYLGQYVERRNKQYASATKDSLLAYNYSKELSSRILGSLNLHRRFRPQFLIDFNHVTGKFEKYGVFLSQRFLRTGQITLSYERNELTSSNNITATISFFTNFIDVSNRTRISGKTMAVNQTHRGSVRFDHENKRIMFDRRNQVGFGSAVVRPFLDQNFNGRQDPNEEHLSGLKAKISGVSGRPRGKDRIYYYDRLRAYDEYLVQIDEYSLDDPLLKPSNENYRVTVNPNVVTTIEVPIVTGSELSGTVKRKLDNGSAGVGGIKVHVLNLSRDILTELTTFTDGQFFYLGLLPGNYRAYVDAEQLRAYGYRSEPEMIEFDVRPIEGGEFIENVHFLLVPLSAPVTADNK